MKKILALAMVLGVLGAFLGGCAKKEEEATATPATPNAEAPAK